MVEGSPTTCGVIVLASCTLLVLCCGQRELPRALSARDVSMVAPDDNGALTLLMLSLFDKGHASWKGKTHALDFFRPSAGYS